MLAGQMARDDALAERLYTECDLFVVAPEINPGLIDKVGEDRYCPLDDMKNGKAIAAAAIDVKADMFITHSDDALAANVVGEVERAYPRMLMGSPNREASRVEWDKLFLRKLVAEIDTELGTSYNPDYRYIDSSLSKSEATTQVEQAVKHFKPKGLEIAVKPRNLTGGKGVKVMGEQLESYEESKTYALNVLSSTSQEGVLIEERLEGPEFTVQAFTDGNLLIVPPATYDYPHRENGNTGLGTGGMGSFSMADGLLPFLSQDQYNEALDLMRDILDRIDGYKGVLYGSFFLTPKGLKITEINARGGDPELVNILDLLEDDVDMLDVYYRIAKGELKPESLRFKKLASTVVYLVSPDYAYKSKDDENIYPDEFMLDEDIFAVHGCRTYFAGARRLRKNQYMTWPARAVAISALGETPWEARDRIVQAVVEGTHGSLDWRRDVGDKKYVRNLGENLDKVVRLP